MIGVTMERPPRNPQRISRRVLGNWEKLVAKAVRTELGRASYNRDGRGRGSNSGQRGQMAPQSLAQQADIDAVLQAVDEIGHENVQVARICKFSTNIASLVCIALIISLSPNICQGAPKKLSEDYFSFMGTSCEHYILIVVQPTKPLMLGGN